MSKRTEAANFVRLATTEETGVTGLTFTFTSTEGAPDMPAYAVVALSDDTSREVVKFTTKTATTLQCAALSDRYLPDGSVAESGIVHPPGTEIIFAPVAQHLRDIWDDVEGFSSVQVVAGTPDPVVDGDVWVDTTIPAVRYRDSGSTFTALPAGLATETYVDDAIDALRGEIDDAAIVFAIALGG